AQREAIAHGTAPTGITRAFTGRAARGIVNRFVREHSTDAPSAYPEIHHLTAAVRAAARERGDAGGFHLGAGQADQPSRAVHVADRVAQLVQQTRTALDAAAARAERPKPESA